MPGFRWLFDRIDPYSTSQLQLQLLPHPDTCHETVSKHGFFQKRKSLASFSRILDFVQSHSNSFLFGGIFLLFLTGCHQQKKLAQDTRPKLNRVYFHGVQLVKESDIRKRILAENPSWNLFLRKDRYLDHPFALDLDRERIVAYYRDRGYEDTKVRAELKPFPDDPKKPNLDTILPDGITVDVHFYVEEGLPLTISQIELLNIQKPKQEEPTPLKEPGKEVKLVNTQSLNQQEYTRMKERIKLKVGQILDRDEYLKEKGQLLEWLKRQGYAFAQVGIQVIIDKPQKTAKIEFSVDSGKKAVFGTISVEGCEKTEPKLVANYAALRTGSPYHPDEINAAERKLYSLGLFSNIEFKLNFVEGYEPVAHVRILVKEEKPQDVQVGVGLGLESSRTEVRARAVYTHRNFLGGLRNFRLSGALGWTAIPAFWAKSEEFRQGPVFDLDAQLIQPDVFGLNSDLRFNFGYHLGVEYAYQFHGPTFAIGGQKSFWNRRIQLGLSYHFQYLQFFNTSDAFQIQDPSKAGALFGYTDPYRLGYLQQDFALDLRNRTIDPTRGFYFGLRAEEGGNYTGGDFSYQKLQPEVRAYYTVGSKVRFTFAGRVQFGQLFSGSPITQRFYLGGPNSHRGFNYNRLSYQVCSIDQRILTEQKVAFIPLTCKNDYGNEVIQNNVQRIPIGGDQMFLTQLEVRARLFQLFGNWFSLAAFLDGGDVSSANAASCKEEDCKIAYNDKIDFTNLHWAVGGGIRYQTILGTLRFDLGVRLNRLDFQEMGQNILNPDPGNRITYHISIGEAF